MASLTVALVCFKWRYERVQLGVRNGQRSFIYLRALVVSGSLVMLLVRLAQLASLF